jgi:uncharacterized protein YecE (DUF72 family)
LQLWVGTSGYSYPAWKGPFYPGDLAAGDMLRFYAERLPAVEINNTFYRLPRASVLEAWRRQVPDGFRFALKASRRITHFARLKPEAAEPTAYLLATAAALGDTLGVLLFQLPPNLKKDLPRLAAFTELLPAGTRAAFEFRHPSWFEDDVYALLRAKGCAFVAMDTDAEDAGAPLVATAPFGYLRLRRPDYSRADLAGWEARVRAQGFDEAFVFFKHEDEGAAPRLAAELLAIARRAAERRPARPARVAKRRRKAG